MSTAAAVAAAAKLAPAAAPAAASRSLPSVSFSGAGFLGCYHMGAAACLLDHGHLLRPGDIPRDEAGGGDSSSAPILTGVSAGAIVSAALAAGVRPDDGMSVVMEVSKRTRQHGGTLDVLRPGFSLVDQVEDLLLLSMKKALGGTGAAADDYDVDLFRRRTRNGRNLRIGLTDTRVAVGTPLRLQGNPDAYRYVDGYRDVEDAVAASILSSYIPGMTGTVQGATCPHNAAVRRSWSRILELESLGFVKVGRTGESVVNGNATGSYNAGEGRSDDGDELECPDLYYWDGGLSDVFPTVDESTVVVSPVNGLYSNLSISPALPTEPIDELDDQSIHQSEAAVATGPGSNNAKDTKQTFLPTEIIKRYFDVLPKTVQAHAAAKLGVNRENAETLFRMMKSSDDSVLQERFSCGYDDARRFLSARNMLNVFS